MKLIQKILKTELEKKKLSETMKSFLQIVIVICCLSVCEIGVFSYSLFDNRTLILSDSETDGIEPSLPRNRSGRLFFDELFGLGGYTDRSEESADNSVRSCGCGNDFVYYVISL